MAGSVALVSLAIMSMAFASAATLQPTPVDSKFAAPPPADPVSVQQRGVADNALAKSPEISAITRGHSVRLVLVAEGPWTDMAGNSLGVARKYELASPVDTAVVALPTVRYVKGRTAPVRGKISARYKGLREISVLVANDGSVQEIVATERDDAIDVDGSQIDTSGVPEVEE